MLLKNLIIAYSALEIVQDTPETFCDAIYDLIECPRFVISVLHLTCNITNFEMSKSGVRDL